MRETYYHYEACPPFGKRVSTVAVEIVSGSVINAVFTNTYAIDSDVLHNTMQFVFCWNWVLG